jgi:hypothetical protein
VVTGRVTSLETRARTAANPPAYSALTEPSGTPAWKSIPSWAVIGTADHVIPLAEQLNMARNADAHVTEINARTCP